MKAGGRLDAVSFTNEHYGNLMCFSSFILKITHHTMAEHLSQSELDYPFKLLEYFNGFRVSKVGSSRLKS